MPDYSLHFPMDISSLSQTLTREGTSGWRLAALLRDEDDGGFIVVMEQ
jgi:hypothetical protein